MGKNTLKPHQNPTPVGRIVPVKSNTGAGGFDGSTKVPTTQTSAEYSGPNSGRPSTNMDYTQQD